VIAFHVEQLKQSVASCRRHSEGGSQSVWSLCRSDALTVTVDIRPWRNVMLVERQVERRDETGTVNGTFVMLALPLNHPCCEVGRFSAVTLLVGRQERHLL